MCVDRLKDMIVVKQKNDENKNENREKKKESIYMSGRMN